MQTDFYFADRQSVFFSPRKLVLSVGASKTVGAEVKALGSRKSLIVTDPGVLGTGTVEAIRESILAEGVEVIVFDRVEIETPARVIDECAAFARREKCDAVIGLGGGTVLDTTKGASLMAINKGSVLDYEGVGRVPLGGLPKVMIPTTAGSGSEVTRAFGVTDEAHKAKTAVVTSHNLADVVILDPLLTRSLPPVVTAETGLDALAHAVESYTSPHATPFSDMLAFEAIRLVGKSLLTAYCKGDNIEARLDMLLAASLAGLAFTSGSLGAPHALGFVLEEEFGLPHARAVSLMLPLIMEYNRIAALPRFASVAAALGEETGRLSADEAAARAVLAVERLLGQMGISRAFDDYGISRDDVPRMAARAAKQARLLGMNTRAIGEEDVFAIFMRGFR